MRIDQIKIGDRVRKDMGDLASLAQSIKTHGLMHPVVVKPDGMLIAGHRRLEAAQLLGWTEIEVTVIEPGDLLSAERDENAERKDFTPTEAVAIGRLIEEQEKPKAQQAKRNSGLRRAASRGFNIGSDKIPEPIVCGEIAPRAASAVGLGTSTYRFAKEIVAAAETNPDAFGDLPARMDETGNVAGTHRELRRRQNSEPEPQTRVLKRQKRPARHPMFKKMHYVVADRVVEKAVIALDAICHALEITKPEQLDADRISQWSKGLKKLARRLTSYARRIAT